MTASEPVELLREVFAQRRAKNPSYSLRAFSRSLGISPARLADLLNRRRVASSGQIEKISESLMLTPAQKSRLLASVHSEKPRKTGARRIAGATAYAQFDMDVFKFVSDWYYSAILCLLQTKGARAEPQWIAKKLGISSIEAKAAVERLSRLDLLQERNDRLEPTHANLSTSTDIPSAALRALHKQMLQKANAALQNQPVFERDITSITMAVAKAKLPVAKIMIRDFRRKLSAFLESDEKDSVYALNIQLFELSKSKEK